MAPLLLSVTTTPASAGSLLLLDVLNRGTGQLELAVTNNAGLPIAVMPPAGVRQDAGLLVRVDGFVIPAKWIAGPCSVTLSANARATWSLTMAIEQGVPIGTMLAYKGAPPGLSRIDVSGIYRLADGTIAEVPLIKDGISDVAEVSAPGGGRQLKLSGLDAGGRVDRSRVTLVLPGGHNTDRSEVIAQLAEAAGVDAESITLTSTVPMAHPVDLSDEGDWLSTAQALSEIDGRALVWDGDGRLTNPVLRQEIAPFVQGELADKNLLSASLAGSLDTPTRVMLTGQEVIPSNSDGGITTRVTTVETREFYQPLYGVTLLQPDCDELPWMGTPPAPRDTVTFRSTLTEEVHPSGEILSSVEVQETWYAIESVHHRLDSDGALTNCAPLAIRLTDGRLSEANYDQLRETQRVATTRSFDDDGYLLSEVTSVSRWGWTSEYSFDTAGVGSYNTRDRTEDNDPKAEGSLPFDGLPRGSQTYRMIERTTILYTVIDGVIQQTREELETIHARPGFRYLYTNGRTSDATVQSLQLAKVTTTTYSLLSDSEFETRELVTDLEGGTGDHVTTTRGVGGLPPAPFLDPAAVQTREISASVESQELLQTRPPYTLKEEAEWAENTGELVVLAKQMLEEESSLSWSGSLPANFLVRPPVWWEFGTHVATGEDLTGYMVRIDEVSHEWAPGQAVTTQMRGIVPVIGDVVPIFEIPGGDLP